MSRDLTAHNLYIFGSRQREGFNMSDLGEALVTSSEGGGGGGGIGIFHSEEYGFTLG